MADSAESSATASPLAPISPKARGRPLLGPRPSMPMTPSTIESSGGSDSEMSSSRSAKRRRSSPTA